MLDARTYPAAGVLKQDWLPATVSGSVVMWDQDCLEWTGTAGGCLTFSLSAAAL